MPRTYKPKPGGKRYTKYDKKLIRKAIEDLKLHHGSIMAVSRKYGITKSTLFRHYKNKNIKCQGGQVALTPAQENIIVERINTCIDLGCPLDKTDLRKIIKIYIDSKGIVQRRFNNNTPSIEYINGFLKRHSHRISMNFTKTRKHYKPQSVTEEDVKKEDYKMVKVKDKLSDIENNQDETSNQSSELNSNGFDSVIILLDDSLDFGSGDEVEL